MASAGAVVGSLIVAIVALYTVWTTREQIRILEKQALFQRSDIYPLLEVKSKRVTGNRVELVMQNRGNGPAFDVAVESTYFLIKASRGEPDWRNEFKYTDDERTYPFKCKDCASFFRGTKTASRLYAGDEDTFTAEPRFYAEFNESKTSMTGKAFTFDELKAALLKDGFDAVGISLSVVGKDITENYMDRHPLYSLLVDLHKHASLENVAKGGNRFSAFPVSTEEISWMPWDEYENAKSEKAFLEDPFRKYRERE